MVASSQVNTLNDWQLEWLLLKWEIGKKSHSNCIRHGLIPTRNHVSRESRYSHFVIHKVILLKSVDYINRLNKIYPFFCCNDHNFYFSIEKNDWQLTDNNGIYRKFKSIKPLIDRLSLTINEWWRYKRKSLNIFAYGRKIWKWEDRIRGSIIAWSYQFDEIKFLYFFYISK